MCHSFGTIRSRYACPTQQHYHHPDTETEQRVSTADVAIIIGSIGGAVLVAFAVIIVIVVVFVVLKRKQTQQNSIYSDMIGSSPSYTPETHDTVNTAESEDARFITPGLAVEV